jgi:Mce-associated membrane protein
VGVAPRRFTDSTVSDLPKDGLSEDEESPAGESAAAAGAFAADDPAAENGAAENGAAENGAADEAADEAAPVEAGRAKASRKTFRERAAAPEARRPMLIMCAVFAVLVVALAVIAVLLGLRLAGQQRQQDDQQAALHAGRQAAADLMTVSYQTAGADINRIMGVATGPFYNQVNADRKQLISQTQSAHAVSTANVLGAGLVGGQVTGNTATVIVVVDSTITSKNAPNGVVNHYRETITLTRTGGRWLASQVDFATPSGGQ